MRWLLAFPALALVLAPLTGPWLATGIAWPAEMTTALARGAGLGAASTGLAILAGAPAALGLRHVNPRVRAMILAGLALPWLVPPEVLALALAPLVRFGGGTAAIILAGSLLAAGPVTLSAWLALRRVGEGERRAAQAAGATSGLVLRRLLLPRLARGTALGALVGFAAAAGQATLPARLGSPGWRTLPALVPDMLRDAAAPEAAAAALLALVIPLVAAGLAYVLVRRGSADRPDLSGVRHK